MVAHSYIPQSNVALCKKVINVSLGSPTESSLLGETNQIQTLSMYVRSSQCLLISSPSSTFSPLACLFLHHLQLFSSCLLIPSPSSTFSLPSFTIRIYSFVPLSTLWVYFLLPYPIKISADVSLFLSLIQNISLPLHPHLLNFFLT